MFARLLGTTRPPVSSARDEWGLDVCKRFPLTMEYPADDMQENSPSELCPRRQPVSSTYSMGMPISVPEALNANVFATSRLCRGKPQPTFSRSAGDLALHF